MRECVVGGKITCHAVVAFVNDCNEALLLLLLLLFHTSD